MPLFSPDTSFSVTKGPLLAAYMCSDGLDSVDTRKAASYAKPRVFPLPATVLPIPMPRLPILTTFLANMPTPLLHIKARTALFRLISMNLSLPAATKASATKFSLMGGLVSTSSAMRPVTTAVAPRRLLPLMLHTMIRIGP